jgi:hypothetical protein
MAGHSRSKNGVASLAYAPAIHAFSDFTAAKTWMPAQTSLRSLRKLDCERGHDGHCLTVIV